MQVVKGSKRGGTRAALLGLNAFRRRKSKEASRGAKRNSKTRTSKQGNPSPTNCKKKHGDTKVAKKKQKSIGKHKRKTECKLLMTKSLHINETEGTTSKKPTTDEQVPPARTCKYAKKSYKLE